MPKANTNAREYLRAHSFYGAFARGMYIPGAAAKDFPEILRSCVSFGFITEHGGCALFSLVSVVDASGMEPTTLIDHHAQAMLLVVHWMKLPGLLMNRGFAPVFAMK
jgi:hypothetical protein